MKPTIRYIVYVVFSVSLIFGSLIGISWDMRQTQTIQKPRLTFMSNRDGNWEIYVMEADGKNPRNLTNHPSDDQFPAWSFDGKKIGFRSKRDGNSEIYVMNSDGTNPTNLTNHPSTDSFPSWSPDGKRLAFYSNRDGNWEIYVMDSDGKNVRNLTNHPASDSNPSWSPDGKKIAFNSRRDGNYEIYLMDAADGGNQKNLTNLDGVDDADASWFDPNFAKAVNLSGKLPSIWGKSKLGN